MSEMWNRTLVYLGLREEPEEMYDELPERFDPEDDPYAEHAPQRPRDSRTLVGATAGSRGGRRPEDGERSGSSAGRAEHDRPAEPSRERVPADDSNVRALRSGDPHVRAVSGGSQRAARVALVDVDTFEEVEAVGSRYRTGQPVLFDITTSDRAIGQRVVDFVSGLTYASRGRLTKVGSRSFLLVPDGVQLSSDELHRLRGLGYRVPEPADS